MPKAAVITIINKATMTIMIVLNFLCVFLLPVVSACRDASNLIGVLSPLTGHPHFGHVIMFSSSAALHSLHLSLGINSVSQWTHFFALSEISPLQTGHSIIAIIDSSITGIYEPVPRVSYSKFFVRILSYKSFRF